MIKVEGLKENRILLTSLLFVFILASWRFGALTVAKPAFLGIALFLLSSIILSSTPMALLIILAFAFTRGALQYIGVPNILSRSIMEFTILLLLAKSLYLQSAVKKGPIKVVGLLPMLCLFIISLVSFVINGQELFPFLLFLRDIFNYYLFFIALLNLDLSEETVRKINRFLVILFLIQIPAALVKFVLRGASEAGVGTVAVMAGSLSTVLALFAIAILFSFYLLRRDRIYLWLILGYFIFGMIGEKRAVPFYVPLVIVFLYFVEAKGSIYKRLMRFNRAHVKTFVLVGLISLLGLYLAAKTQPSLNPDNRVGGRFDIRYILQQGIQSQMEHTAFEKERMITEKPYTFGRVASTVHSYNILEDRGRQALFLGLGAGMLTSSSFVRRSMDDVYLELGIKGGRTGLVVLMLQVGLSGVIFFLIFYLLLLGKAFRIYRGITDPYWRPIALAFIGVTFVLILDFLTYSITGIFTGILTPVYFYIAAVSFKRFSYERNLK